MFFSHYCAEGCFGKFFCTSLHLRRIRNSIKRRKSAFCCLGSLSFLCRQTSPCDSTSLPSKLNARTYQPYPRRQRKTLKQSFPDNMEICLNETMQIRIVRMRVNGAKTSGRWKKINFNLANRQSGMRRNKSHDLIALSVRKQNREMFSILSCFIVSEVVQGWSQRLWGLSGWRFEL